MQTYMQKEKKDCIMPYQLIDKQTGGVVGTYQKRSTAIKKRNTKDNEYGGYRFRVDLVKKKSDKLKIRKA